MAVCPVCGCKTDDLDFVKGKIAECEADVCSFCNKQLKGFEGITEASEAQARWLGAVLDKEVPDRSEDVLNALRGMGAEFLAEKAEPAPVKAATQQNGGFMPTTVPVAIDDKDRAIAQLTERLEGLEKQLRVMKRSMLIKSIIEICVPIILGILILIVFFASGLYDTLASLYSNF